MDQEFILPFQNNLPLFIKANPSAADEIFVDWHYHEDLELILIEQGEFDLFIGNKKHTIYAGDIVFINSFVPHKTHTPANNIKLLLQFKHNLFAGEQKELSLLLPLLSKRNDYMIFKKGTAINEQLTPNLKKLSEEFTAQHKSYAAFIKALFYEILAVLYRFNVLDDPEDFSFPPQIERLLPVLHYIYDNVAFPVSLKELSELVHIERSYFCRLFKRTMNMSLMDYVYILRLNKAEELLLNSDKSITEIAIESGFSSPSYFTKIFKEKKGYTPTFYKNLTAHEHKAQH